MRIRWAITRSGKPSDRLGRWRSSHWSRLVGSAHRPTSATPGTSSARTSTPVWNSLPKFGAARGGIRFPVIPTIANITTATTTVTAAQDAAGGTTAIKGCQEVTCPSFSEVLVDIVAACLQFPNLTARTYPEMVAGWNELLAIALAQEIESKILTSIQAGSTDVSDIAEGTTVPTDLGAIGQLYPVLLQAAARLRNNMRLDPNVALPR